MTCESIRAALSSFDLCVETEDGARVSTHCLYPSFDPVNVFVVGFGDGFIVHDSGGAFRSAWDHAKDESVIRRSLSRQAQKYRVSVDNDALSVAVSNVEWLLSAILAVANASASAAHAAIEHVIVANENRLKQQILSTLSGLVLPRFVTKDYEVAGRSGKLHHFDFGVRYDDGGLILINAVWPHHVSVAAKYVAFADTRANDGLIDRFAVYDKELDASDVSLMQQVADLMPIRALGVGVKRAFAHDERH